MAAGLLSQLGTTRDSCPLLRAFFLFSLHEGCSMCPLLSPAITQCVVCAPGQNLCCRRGYRKRGSEVGYFRRGPNQTNDATELQLPHLRNGGNPYTPHSNWLGEIESLWTGSMGSLKAVAWGKDCHFPSLSGEHSFPLTESL